MQNVLRIVFFLTGFSAACQSIPVVMGGRAAGLGFCTAAVSDAWSILNNPAGLSDVREIVAGAAQEVSPGLEGAGRSASVLSMPVMKSTAGAALFRFGDAFYNEQLLSAAVARTAGIASLGVRVSLVQYHADGYPSKAALNVAFGGIASITPRVKTAAFITNLTQSAASPHSHELLPVQMTAGIRYEASDKFFFAAEVMKDLDYPPVVRACTEFIIHRQITLRTGYNTRPDAGFFGIGMRYRQLSFDYAVEYRTLLGIGHHLSVTCRRPSKSSRRAPAR